MARGVADVLALYLEAPTAPGEPGPKREALSATSTLTVSGNPASVVESFLVWNLNIALTALGRPATLHATPRSDAKGVLLLVHSSEAGLRRAECCLAELQTELRIDVVVYGDRASGESGTWARRLAERGQRRRGALLHRTLIDRGGLVTGPALARSILRREAIVLKQRESPAGRQFLAVAERLSQPVARGVHSAD